MKTIGTLLIIIGIVFCIYETNQFGHNLLPQTFFEGFCDLVSLCLVIAGNLIINSKIRK